MITFLENNTIIEIFEKTATIKLLFGINFFSLITLIVFILYLFVVDKLPRFSSTLSKIIILLAYFNLNRVFVSLKIIDQDYKLLLANVITIFVFILVFTIKNKYKLQVFGDINNAIYANVHKIPVLNYFLYFRNVLLLNLDRITLYESFKKDFYKIIVSFVVVILFASFFGLMFTFTTVLGSTLLIYSLKKAYVFSPGFRNNFARNQYTVNSWLDKNKNYIPGFILKRSYTLGAGAASAVEDPRVAKTLVFVASAVFLSDIANTAYYNNNSQRIYHSNCDKIHAMNVAVDASNDRTLQRYQDQVDACIKNRSNNFPTQPVMVPRHPTPPIIPPVKSRFSEAIELFNNVQQGKKQ